MGLLQGLSRLATHPKTVIGLILASLGSCLLSELIPQTAVNGPAYFQKLAQLHPLASAIIDHLSLQSFSSSPWFLTLSFLLAVSLTVSLGQQAQRLLSSRTSAAPPLLLASAPCRLSLPGQPLPTLLGAINTILDQQGYRPVNRPADGRPLALTFAKHQLGRWGALLLHGGLWLLIMAATIGYLTHSRGFVQVMEGETIPAGGHDWLETELGPLASPLRPEFSFRLDRLKVALWPDGSKKSIASALTLTDANGHERRLEPSLAQPIDLAGLTLSQTNHLGYHVSLIIKMPGKPGIPTHFMLDAAKRPQDLPHAKTDFPMTDYIFEISLSPDPERPSFFLNRPQVAVTVTKNDAIVFRGRLRPGQRATLEDNDLYCQAIGYWSGLTLFSGYALPLVYVGFGLIFCGVCLLYFLAPRKIFFRLELLPDSDYEVTMTASGKNAAIFLTPELTAIRQRLSSPT